MQVDVTTYRARHAQARAVPALTINDAKRLGQVQFEDNYHHRFVPRHKAPSAATRVLACERMSQHGSVMRAL
ncbi:hypothetical protein [Branchiibius sp. NY16-3462-2]|uniref:hypothetical protein n=1 Tax=Branchiibius sp. NY16-3462-2 TaxID=1807500 RepID=UPI00079CA0F5|nr:hypothetical protein [Branchiibius sp. NY16-3462-2]KYH44128.1 hypothetical protein AZH51_05190 [Branchiibius sp. NY16-3462-2]